jgi:hypothetical protein
MPQNILSLTLWKEIDVHQNPSRTASAGSVAEPLESSSLATDHIADVPSLVDTRSSVAVLAVVLELVAPEDSNHRPHLISLILTAESICLFRRQVVRVVVEER